jgi:hypothetical protein
MLKCVPWCVTLVLSRRTLSHLNKGHLYPGPANFGPIAEFAALNGDEEFDPLIKLRAFYVS